MYILDNKVVGVLWTSLSDLIYSFDVIVLPEYQRKGIAKELINSAINEYKQLSWDIDDLKIELDVVNTELARYLQSIGFRVTQEVSGHILMELA